MRDGFTARLQKFEYTEPLYQAALFALSQFTD